MRTEIHLNECEHILKASLASILVWMSLQIYNQEYITNINILFNLHKLLKKLWYKISFVAQIRKLFDDFDPVIALTV